MEYCYTLATFFNIQKTSVIVYGIDYNLFICFTVFTESNLISIGLYDVY